MVESSTSLLRLFSPMSPASKLSYLVPYILAMVLPLLMGVLVRRRNQAAVGRAFSAMLFVQAVWAFLLLMEIVSSSLRSKIFWDDLQFAASGLATVLALSFVLRYEGRWFKAGNSTWYLLLGLPVLAGAFALSSSWHGLHRQNPWIDTAVPFGELLYDFPVGMLVFLVPMYCISIYSLYRISRLAFRFRDKRRMAAVCAAAGIGLPLIGLLLTQARLRIFDRLEATSLWFAAGDIFIAVGLFRYRMASVLPVARQTIVEKLRDPVIILDQDRIIVDHNAAVREFFSQPFKGIRGCRAEDVFLLNLAPCLEILQSNTTEAEIRLVCNGTEKDYSLKVFPIAQQERSRILVFRDITSLKTDERKLRILSAELELKVDERARELATEVSRRRSTEEQLARMNSELEGTRNEIMVKLAEVVEEHGRESPRHVARVSEYCRILGLASGLSSEAADMLANAAALHDIGKIATPENILDIPGSLSEDARRIMHCHTRIGAEILGKSDEPIFKLATTIALEHHEHWDGSGYPQGLVGAAINSNARIVAVSDVFDVLASPRSYRKGWALDEILEHFRSQRGKQFEPELVDLLFANLDRLLAVAAHYAEDDRIKADQLIPELPLDDTNGTVEDLS